MRTTLALAAVLCTFALATVPFNSVKAQENATCDLVIQALGIHSSTEALVGTGDRVQLDNVLADAEFTPVSQLPEWVGSLSEFCLEYESRFEGLPRQITPEAVAAARGLDVSQLSLDDWSLVLNPATLSNVRLDAVEYSPGDAFVMVLDETAVARLAEDGLSFCNSGNSSTNIVNINNCTGNSCDSVLYIRSYDINGAILENLVYRCTEVENGNNGKILGSDSKTGIEDTVNDTNMSSDKSGSDTQKTKPAKKASPGSSCSTRTGS